MVIVRIFCIVVAWCKSVWLISFKWRIGPWTVRYSQCRILSVQTRCQWNNPEGHGKMCYRKTWSTDYNKKKTDSKFHGANMGPSWGRQGPGGPHVGPMDLAMWGPRQSKPRTYGLFMGYTVCNATDINDGKAHKSGIVGFPHVCPSA